MYVEKPPSPAFKWFLIARICNMRNHSIFFSLCSCCCHHHLCSMSLLEICSIFRFIHKQNKTKHNTLSEWASEWMCVVNTIVNHFYIVNPAVVSIAYIFLHWPISKRICSNIFEIYLCAFYQIIGFLCTVYTHKHTNTSNGFLNNKKHQL